MKPPRCNFAIRYPDGNGGWYYQRILPPGPDGHMYVSEAPAVDDLIHLWDRTGWGGVYRVIERSWLHASWGSPDFPYGQREPSTGPLLDIIVEPDEGPYRNEAPTCAEPDCPAVLTAGGWLIPAHSELAEAHEHRPYEPRQP